MVTTEQEAMNLSDKDVKLTARQIAEAVWNAAHSNKMHHYIGTDSKLFRLVKWLVPQSILVSYLKNTFYKESLKRL